MPPMRRRPITATLGMMLANGTITQEMHDAGATFRSLFYMAARGIPPLVVRRLLVQAFLGDAFVALEDEREREQLMHAALTALGDAV